LSASGFHIFCTIDLATVNGFYTIRQTGGKTLNIAGPSNQPGEVPQSDEVAAPALLFEMMRSFVTLANTLNLTHTVKKLDSTRQTVRRHIAALEHLKGGSLFDVSERRYSLTALGERILPEATELLITSESWVTGHYQLVNGLPHLSYEQEDGWFLYQQQHPLHRAISSKGGLLHRAIKAWANSGGNLGHEDMREIRPVCNVFRRKQEDLIFTEVGAESSFVSWFGPDKADSCIGLSVTQMPGGDSFWYLANAAYWEIEKTHSLRLDHIYTIMPYGADQRLTHACYERLMLGASDPDGSPAIISLVRRTHDIEIFGLGQETFKNMPDELLM
jgi:hypothetical protein